MFRFFCVCLELKNQKASKMEAFLKQRSLSGPVSI